MSMQHKLDDLCNQMNPVKDQTDLEDSEAFRNHKIKFLNCRCWLCDEHLDLLVSLYIFSCAERERKFVEGRLVKVVHQSTENQEAGAVEAEFHEEENQTEDVGFQEGDIDNQQGGVV
uniref:Uncharacterized protein n=1 Tax=Cucumis melo TaxID=3656 RepID=A0A9I9EJ56_CUCME